jgi:RNA polymerase sigma-70 factor (ECF subfamily)
MAEDPNDAALLRSALAGDSSALGQILATYRDRLRAAVRLRLDGRLRGRVDPSDVVQESFLEATERFRQYARDPDMPFYLWVRFLTLQNLQLAHRRHLGVRARDARREVGLEAGTQASSAALAALLAGRLTSPSRAAARAEDRDRVRAALDGLDAADREVLALRHFEQLTNAETARVLGLGDSAASQRYVRALGRLQAALGGTARE